MKLGPQRFTKRFRLTTGMSPWQYVQARRVRRAKSLLAQRKISLAEITPAACRNTFVKRLWLEKPAASAMTASVYRNCASSGRESSAGPSKAASSGSAEASRFPRRSRAATDEYFAQEDALGRWLEERCTPYVNGTAAVSALWADWK